MAPDGSNKRILLVDGQPILRHGLRHIIESQRDLAVCAEVDTEREASAAIRELLPDAVVTDISLREGDGIALVRHIRAHHPELPLLVFSNHDEVIYAERMLEAGANGYIMKKADTAAFLDALRRVLAGEVFFSVATDGNCRRFAAERDYAPVNPVERLSNREVQILRMIGKGMSTRESAQSLNLSVKTVESHRQRIKRKLNLHSGVQLMQCAVNWFGDASREPARPARRPVAERDGAAL